MLSVISTNTPTGLNTFMSDRNAQDATSEESVYARSSKQKLTLSSKGR